MSLFSARKRTEKAPPPGRGRPNGSPAQGHPGQHRVPTGEGWLSVHEVRKSYRSQPVVRGVSLAARRGEAVGILGPNGAGKTTLFYMITGLVAADAGRVTLDGRDVTRLPMYRRARLGIGYLPQEQSIFRGLSAEQNIMGALELVEPNRRKRREQLDNLLEEFGIAHKRKAPAIALSGGERRRLEIARALATDPQLIALDEPAAGMNATETGQLKVLIEQIRGDGITVMLIEHDVKLVMGLCDRVAVLDFGRKIAEDVPAEVQRNEAVINAYLGGGHKHAAH